MRVERAIHTGAERAAACAAVVLAMAGCADPDAADGGVVVRDSAGITIVENEYGRPRWTPRTAWRLAAEPLARIGTVDGPAEQQLYQAFSSRRLRDGRIAVVNTSSRQIRIYDEAGRWQSSIGGAGDGPGEFRSVWKVHEMPGDSLLAVDLGRHISVFDAEHTFVRRYLPERLDSIPMGEGFEPVGQFADGSLLFRSHIRGDPVVVDGIRRNQIQMLRIDRDGRIAAVLGPYHDQSTQTEAGARYLFGAWAKEAASDSTLWYGPGDRFEIREIAMDGRVLRMVRLDRPAAPITASFVREYVDRLIERARSQRPGSEQILQRMYADAVHPATLPAHYEILVDDAGNLWVQDYRPFDERVERVWSVFDPDGRFLGDITAPAGFTVHHIGDDFVLGRWTDDLDVEYVLVYRLEKPGR
jgi:hypothetical protein